VPRISNPSQLTLLQRLENLARTFDVESLSYLCKMLYTHEDVLDVISLHVKMSDIIFHTLTFLEDYDCQTVGTLLLLLSPRTER